MSAVDWDAMEPEWRAGIMSVKALSERYGVSRAAINKHWAKRNISRDLGAKIKQAAAAKVTHDAVTPEVTQQRRVTEQQVIEANANLQGNIIRGQRKLLSRASSLVDKLFAELEGVTDEQDLIEQLVDTLAQVDGGEVDEDERKTLYRMLNYIQGIPGRVEMSKKLIEALERLINMQRRVYNIEDEAPPENPLAALVMAIQGKSIRPKAIQAQVTDVTNEVK